MPELSAFDGTALAFEEEGGSGDPVVLLHGLSSSTEGNWRQPGIWSALTEAGHRVVGFDARGHGRSGKPHDPAAYAGDAMVRDLSTLLDALGLARVDLVGYSMGASTALQFAASAARPDQLRRLVLGGIGGDPREWGDDDERRALPRRWLAGLEAPDAGAIEDPVARRARKVFEGRGNDLRAMAALLRAERVHLSRDIPLQRVTVPTLVVCGDRDAAPGPLADALVDGTALVLEGDHESVVPNPELAKAIVGFLEP